MGELTDDGWYETINGDLSMVYLLITIAWPYLEKAGLSSIINLASVNSWVTLGALPAVAHTAAKGGVLIMMRQLSMEGCAHGIRANTVSPGVIETRATSPHMKNAEWSETMLKKIMLDRFGQPEEVAALASFLASDESSYVTGADLLMVVWRRGETAW